MNFLRQSTAVDIGIGPFIDDDGITPATGLTITQAETRLKKNNGAWAQVNDATSATHEEEGWYEKELDATDTNTVGILIVAVYISGSLAYWKEFQVVEEAVYDALFAASAVGPLLANSDGSGFTAINLPNQTMDIVGNITGNLSGSVGSVTGLTAADVGAIKAKTDNLPTDPADQSLVIAATDALATLIADLPTNAELATSQAAADDATLAAVATVDTVVDAIKVQTDKLTFTVTNVLDANITHVIADPVQEAGSTATNWGGAP